MSGMRLIFVGCSSAFAVGPEAYHSNMVIESENEYFLVDCGGDIRRSLFESGLSYHEMTNIYISHLHGDHTFGLEWLGLSRYFDPTTPLPKLYLRDTLVEPLWENTLKGPMSTLKNIESKLSTFFDVQVLKEGDGFTWKTASFELIPVVHYYSNGVLAPCYGLMIRTDRHKTLLTTDTQFTPERLTPYYEEADLILHDCETSNYKSSVHAHYTELVNLPSEIKSKMWLYHYNNGHLPDADKDGFGGFVRRGQYFEI